MKKTIISTIILLFLIGTGIFYYFYFIPNKVTHKILEKNPQVRLTEEEQEALGVETNHKIPVKKIIQLSLQENDIQVVELIDLIKDIEPEQVETFMDDYSKIKDDSIGLTFEQVKSHFDFGDFPIDSFQTEFDILYDENKMAQAYDLYEKNKDQLPLILPMLKKSVIRYLNKIEPDTLTTNKQ